jgi:hypothetical protein
MATELNIKDGPAQPDLELGLYPERHLTLTFATDGASLVVGLEKMKEIPDGTEFELKGYVMSEPHRNKAFTALYDVETHTGTIQLMNTVRKRRDSTPKTDPGAPTCTARDVCQT